MDKRRIITHGDMEEDNIQWEEISKVMSKGKEASKPAAKAEPSRPTPPPPKTYSSLYAELWDKCNPKKRRAAAVRCLHEFALDGPVLQ